MIRFAISQNELGERIETCSPGWLRKAELKTATLRNGSPQRITNLWSEIKQVYLDLECPKCAFCEKWVEGQPVEHDVEHFRPKNRIKRWRIPADLQREGIQMTQPAAGTEAGYRLLAYHPLNYATACVTCNRILKRCYFPIAGRRQTTSDDPTTMRGEQPFLIYPINDVDDDPEKLIEFYGLSPRPKQGGFSRKRALVTIALFRLDDARRRPDLLKARAGAIEHLYFALRERARAATSVDRARAEAAVRRLTSPREAHTNCLRSFQRLWESNRPEAEAVYQHIADWLRGVSP